MSMLNELFGKKTRKVVDLYYHLSRALYYDVDKKKLIEGNEAEDIYIKRMNMKEVGKLDVSEGVKVDVWGDGKPITISGIVWEI